MTSSDPKPLGQTGTPPETDFYNLDPNHTGAPKALITEPADHITSAGLCKLVLDSESAPHTARTLTAADLTPSPETPATSTVPISRADRIKQATYAINVQGATQPSTADILPPHTLRVHPASHTPLCRRLLQKNHILTTQKAAQIIAILLALPAALSPDLDGDGIDDDTRHPTLSFAT